MWLLNSLKPDHNTISNFRRDNPKAIKKVFRETVRIARHFNLIGGTLIAGDSTKFRAQNSKKNNFNQKKIDRHVKYIDNKLNEYNQALAEGDGDNTKQAEQEIKKDTKSVMNKKRRFLDSLTFPRYEIVAQFRAPCYQLAKLLINCYVVKIYYYQRNVLYRVCLLHNLIICS
ncbi:hypothetical protein ES703_93835 [subsurface metagenome]